MKLFASCFARLAGHLHHAQEGSEFLLIAVVLCTGSGSGSSAGCSELSALVLDGNLYLCLANSAAGLQAFRCVKHKIALPKAYKENMLTSPSSLPMKAFCQALHSNKQFRSARFYSEN